MKVLSRMRSVAIRMLALLGKASVEIKLAPAASRILLRQVYHARDNAARLAQGPLQLNLFTQLHQQIKQAILP